MRRILAMLMIFTPGCGPTANMGSFNTVAEKNKDVLLLAMLVQDQLRTNERQVNLATLLQHDTLKRLSNSFKTLELKLHGGYISVQYTFAGVRANKIVLTDEERKRVRWVKWQEKDIHGAYDGEMRFDFGERFYLMRKIIVRDE